MLLNILSDYRDQSYEKPIPKHKVLLHTLSQNNFETLTDE